MQDRSRRDRSLKALFNWSAAIASLMIILAGGFLPVGIAIPSLSLTPRVVELPGTWQIPSLLLCSLIWGPKSGVLAASAYLTIGVLHMPIFQGGGGFNYISTPGFGYLVGFIPAAWLTGKLAHQPGMRGLISQTLAAWTGLFCLHICGLTNIIIGVISQRWSFDITELFYSYTLGPLPTQLALCTSVGIISILIKSLLLIE